MPIQTHTLEKITADELSSALRAMKCGKARDDAGVIVELIKSGSDKLREAILHLFNDVLHADQAPPEKWKRTRLTMIFKKGDPGLSSNYRPIAILPIVYKVFSRIVCTRIAGGLMAQ